MGDVVGRGLGLMVGLSVGLTVVGEAVCGGVLCNSSVPGSQRGEFKLERETKLVYGRRALKTAAVGAEERASLRLMWRV